MVHPRLHALLVAAVAAIVLGANLGGPALWDDDEPKNAACSLAMLDANDWVVPTFNARLRVEKPPLVNWLQIAGYTLCGRNETGARIGSAIATLGACLFTWRIGCLLLGPAAGLLGGLVMASCVWTAVGGRAATPDAPLLFFTTLALWLFVRAWHRDRQPGGGVHLRRADAAAIGAACGAAVLAKGLFDNVLSDVLWARAIQLTSPTLATVALRPHLIWGPNDPQLTARILARGRAGRLRLVGGGLKKIDSVYIDNAVSAHLLALDRLVREASARAIPWRAA